MLCPSVQAGKGQNPTHALQRDRQKCYPHFTTTNMLGLPTADYAMLSDLRPPMEDLPELAAEAFEVAQRLCVSCQNYHSLWTYHRIAGASGGDVGRVRTALAGLLSSRSRKILIAGSADSGSLAVVSQIAHPGSHIVVVDQCGTPLELCRRFAKRAGLAVETLRFNLAELPAKSTFDIVFAHSILQHIAADRRVEVLSHLARSLVPSGRLVIAFRTSARIEGELLQAYQERYAKYLIERLDAANIPLPESRDAFLRRVEIYAEERLAREGTHGSREEVERLLNAAGFAIDEITPIETNQSEPFLQFATKIAKQRYLAIATPTRRL